MLLSFLLPAERQPGEVRFQRTRRRLTEIFESVVHRHRERTKPGTAAPAPQPAPEPQNDLGALLSPSQTNKYLNCPAAWWFKYGAGLPDPPGASLVRGKVVHRVAEEYYRNRMAGVTLESEALLEPFERYWEEGCADAVFGKDEDIDDLKRGTAALARKYLDEVAPEINPAQVEYQVSGAIGGVNVRGFIDLIDTRGTIVDLKTAKKKPSGITPDYRLQLATYRQLVPFASGLVRLDTLVATKKTMSIVKMEYEVTPTDVRYAQTIYPLVREAIREGLYLPNRNSNLCSMKYCPYASACLAEFGGSVKGDDEE